MSSTWAHADRRSLELAIASGLTRAIPSAPVADPPGFGPGQSAAGCAQDLRALLIYSAIVTYNAGKDGPIVLPLSKLTGLPPAWASMSELGEPQAVAMTRPLDLSGASSSVVAGLTYVGKAWFALASRNAHQAGRSLELPYVYGCATNGGDEPEPLSKAIGDAGAAPLIAVVAIVSGAVALAYLGAHALDAYERNLAREADSRRLVALTASSTQVLASHVEADKATGKSTPLSTGEQAVIDALAAQIKAYAPTAPPPPKPPEPFDPNKLAASATSIAVPLILVIGAALFLRSSKS